MRILKESSFQYIDFRDHEEQIRSNKDLNSSKPLKIVPMSKEMQKALFLDGIEPDSANLSKNNRYLENTSIYFSSESKKTCYVLGSSTIYKGHGKIYLELFIDTNSDFNNIRNTMMLFPEYGVYALLRKTAVNSAHIQYAKDLRS